jgi:hypothetical protein
MDFESMYLSQNCLPPWTSRLFLCPECGFRVAMEEGLAGLGHRSLHSHSVRHLAKGSQQEVGGDSWGLGCPGLGMGS